MIVPWRRGTSAAHFLDDALSAMTAADWAGDDPPIACAHWPVDLANPYQALIYSRFAGQNLVPIRLRQFTMIDSLVDALPEGVTTVLHVHWLYDVTAGSTGESDALARVTRFEKEIQRLRGQGLRLVWTVHNVLPHETVHPEVERRLRRFMLETADVVHVMHDSHLDLLRETFGTEPRAAVVVPHPSYAGAYPDYVDRAAARAHLGISRSHRVLVTFGQIRPYKGHDAFLDAFDRAVALDPGLRWLVAGKVRDEPGGREFMRRAAEHPAVLFYPGFVPEADVQFYLRAADAAVYPYQSSLNSGAVALTAGFDLPAYASTGTSLGDLMPAEAVVRFDLADPEGTARILAASPPEVSDSAREAVRAHARGLAPELVSERLAVELRRHVTGQVAASLSA